MWSFGVIASFLVLINVLRLFLNARRRAYGREPVDGLSLAAEATCHPFHCGRDIVGIGQAMVDIAWVVDDDQLRKLNLKKGDRRYLAPPQPGFCCNFATCSTFGGTINCECTLTFVVTASS
jgi:hypothetical protein